MAHYQIILAYDGTEYRGFQRQANAHTIQGSFERALKKLSWDGRSILAAGRTDAGVHAEGQILTFDLDWAHSPEDLRNALNANLPYDIVVREAKTVPTTFHPRFDAISRKYRYSVIGKEIRDPFRERYAWRVWPAPKLSLLQEACQLIIGDHDFAAFGTPPQSGGNTCRKITHAAWIQDGDTFVFEIASRAYLYQMVRRLVAIQILIGQGNLEIQDLKKHLKIGQDHLKSNKILFNHIAPPHGLFLSEVSYISEPSSKS